MAWRWPGGRSPKLLLFGAIVVVLGGLVVASMMQLEGLKYQVADKQRTIQTLTAKNAELQQELTSLEAERRDLEGRLNDVRGQLASASAELTRLRTSVAELQGHYDTLTAEKSQLEARVSQLARERNEAQERVHRLEDERMDLERSSARLRDRFALLDRDYQRVVDRLEEFERQRTTAATPTIATAAVATPSAASAAATPPPAAASPQNQNPASPQTVELPPIVVRKDQAGVSTPLRGRLVEIDDSHQFVVVDQGSLDGVLLGMTFEIVRGTTPVGRIRVVRVRPKLSACDIIRSQTQGSLQVGDLAIQRNL